MGKEWFKSRTLWVNLIGLAAFVIQAATNFVISPEVQAQILLLVNIILRLATNSEIVWSGKK